MSGPDHRVARDADEVTGLRRVVEAVTSSYSDPRSSLQPSTEGAPAP